MKTKKIKRPLSEVLKGMFVHDFEERIYNGTTRHVYVHYWESDAEAITNERKMK